MARKRAFRALDGIDPERLAAFQAGIRRRYGDEELLAELRACAERLGRSPTMREFADDPQTRVHPQTVIEHFGSWNAAKREAGLVPGQGSGSAEGLREALSSRNDSANDQDRARRGAPGDHRPDGRLPG